MAGSAVRVVKVGGSLFDAPQLDQRLARWLRRQTSATNIFIAGGGKLADSIRQFDQLHAIGEEPSHWLCVRALSVTARILIDVLPEAALVDSLEEVRELIATRPSRICVFDPMPMLTGEQSQRGATPLPHSWEVTSDSIAAHLAELLGATELALLKSNLPDPSTIQQASEAHFVDPYFPTAAAKLPLVRCVNLRSEAFEEVAMEM